MALSLIIAACGPSSEEQLRTRQKIYRPLYEAGRAVDAAVASGTSYAQFGVLLQAFSKEQLLATDHVSDEADKALVAAYADALTTWKDSAKIWKTKIKRDGETWIEGYEIATGDPDVVALAKKYELPTTRNKLKDGNTLIALHSDDSLQKVWAIASEKSKKAVGLYLGQ